MDQRQIEDDKHGDPPLRTTQRRYRINRHDISFLRFILEAYDGVAVITTQDGRQGIILIRVAPGSEALVDGIIHQLATQGEIMIEPLAKDDHAWCGPGLRCTNSI